MFARLLAILLALCASAAAEDKVLRGDWTLACDGADCAISTRTPQEDTAFVARRAIPGSGLTFGFRLVSVTPDPDIALVLRVDSGPKLSFYPGRDMGLYGPMSDIFLIDPGLTRRILSAMRSGATLRVYAAQAGNTLSRDFSLKGFDEALARMAELQRRDPDDLAVEEPDAERRDGDARPPVDAGTGPRGLPASVVDRHYRESQCEDLESGNIASRPPLTARLSDFATLYALPCTKSSAGITWRLYVAETGEIGGVSTVHFARFDPRFGWTGSDYLWNLELDAAAGTIATTRHGRGEADCGYFARWSWRETAFALLEVRQRVQCNGGDDPSGWPVVYSSRS